MSRIMDLQLFAEGEKQAPATPRKRREARGRGQVPRSAELTAAAVVLAGGVGVLSFGDAAGAAFRELLGGAASAAAADLTVAGAAERLRHAAWVALSALAGPSLLAAGAGLLVATVQNGALFTLYPLRPSLERLDPVQGVRRLVSLRGAVELAKSLLKLLLIGAVVYASLRAAVPAVLSMTGAPVPLVLAAAGEAVRGLFWRVAVAALVIGAADYAYQRWEHERNLAMTRQELKEEMRETEGDPTTRSRVRRRQRELLRRRMLLDVRRADVVVVNPTEFAVALRYDPETMAAPVVVAKGRDHMARLIRALARRFGVPWVEDRFLARTLFRSVEVGDPVPETLYAAVAEVLAFVWRLKGRSLRDLTGGGR